MASKRSNTNRSRGKRNKRGKRSPFSGMKRNLQKRHEPISQREKRLRARTARSVFDPQDLDSPPNDAPETRAVDWD